MLYTTMIMTFTVGVDLGFVLGCFLLIFYHIASMNERVFGLKTAETRKPCTENFPIFGIHKVSLN